MGFKSLLAHCRPGRTGATCLCDLFLYLSSRLPVEMRCGDRFLFAPLTAEEHVSLEQLWRTANPLEQTHILIVLRSSEGLDPAGNRPSGRLDAARCGADRALPSGILGLHDGRLANPGRRRVVTEEWQRLLLEAKERPPAAWGFTASRWTVRLLVAYLEQATHIRKRRTRRHYLRIHGFRRRQLAQGEMRLSTEPRRRLPMRLKLSMRPTRLT